MTARATLLHGGIRVTLAMPPDPALRADLLRDMGALPARPPAPAPNDTPGTLPRAPHRRQSGARACGPLLHAERARIVIDHLNRHGHPATSAELARIDALRTDLQCPHLGPKMVWEVLSWARKRGQVASRMIVERGNRKCQWLPAK